MTWDDYYEKINEWAVSTAVNRISSLENIGSSDEIVDALNIIAFDDEKGATRLLNKALQFGAIFSGENLAEISGICSEESFKRALNQSANVLTEQDLEDLYCMIDEDLIVEIAKKRKLRLPKDMREDYEEEATDVADLTYEIKAAIEAAEYALDCLIQAQVAINTSSKASFIDMVSGKFFPSLLKYAALNDAEQELRIAQAALESMNFELKNLMQNKTIHIKAVKLSSVIDFWFDSQFMDCLVHMQINKVQKQIKRAISQVEAIKRELKGLVK